MSLFHRKNRVKKSLDSGGDELLERIDGRQIKYACRREEDCTETIIGREGRLVITDTEVAVRCDGKDVFCCSREGAEVGELMALNGVRIRGTCGDGSLQTVVAYYTAYNK